MPKRKLAVVHKWMGLWLAVYFGLQAAAGIVLTYEADLLRWLTPPVAAVEPGNEAAALGEVLSVVQRAYPARNAERINFPAADGLPFLVRLESADGSRQWVQVDPAAATVRPLSPAFRAMDFISDFHINLASGPVGHYLVGITGIVLIGSVVTGFILGWPGLKRLRSALRVSFRVPVTGWFQLHRSMGLLTVLIVFATTFTGTVLVFKPLLEPLFVGGAAPLGLSQGEALPAGVLLRRAQEEFAGADIRSVRLKPGNAVYRVVVSGDRQGMAAPSNQVWIDPATAEVRKRFDAANLTPAEAFFAWMYPLHVEFGLGRAGQVVSVLGALGLLMLSASGMLIWIKRRQMRLSRRTVLTPQRRPG